MDNNFKIEVKNFGAVKDGEFDIKPLTIFIGDNDSGKSYLSKFIYVIVKYLTNTAFFNSIAFNNEVDYDKYKETNVYKIIDSYTKEFTKQNLMKNKNILSFYFDKKYVEYFISDISNVFKRLLKRTFEVYFSNNLNDLININQNSAFIKINAKFFIITIKLNRNNDFDLILEYKEDLEFSVRLLTQITEIESSSFSSSLDENILSSEISITNTNAISTEYLFENVLDLSFHFVNDLLGLKRSINYFPANKSGILSNYNTKFQNNVVSAFDYIFNNKNLNQDNYLINDFIKIIQNFSNESINENISLLESYSYIKNQIDGELYFNSNKMLQYKIGDEKNNLDIPIENISTKVTELTPIILYLEKLDKRFITSIGEFLIIEEPESHLNPKMQRVMARLLVMMMNEGIQILITTHSDYILNEMDILLKLNHIKQKDTKKFEEFISDDKDYEALMALDKDNLSVYRFKKDALDTEIENIKITKNKVIEKEFEETSENLYLENSKVIDILKSI